MVRRGIAALAAVSFLFCAGKSFGQATTQAAPKDAEQTAAPAVASEEAAAPRRPLMGALDRAGMADRLDDARINIFGHVEASSSYNVQGIKGNTGRVFDIDNEEVDLNQFDLTIERTVDVTQKKWDVGARMEWIYGEDAGLIHSNGLFDWYDGPRSPELQLDLNQAYVDVAVPVGNGLLLRGGKMVTHMGYETINPTSNPLFSRSILFGFAIPFTHTGVMGFYNVNDKLSVMLGFSRGWEQSLEDNNDALDYLGQIKYVFNDKTTGYLNLVTGPEQAGNASDYRTVLDVILSHTASDTLTLAVNGDWGFESDGGADGSDAQWFGLAGYAIQKMNDRVSVNGRVEWFDDNDAARGIGTTVYEGTIGLGITPFPNDKLWSNLRLRPELRWDYGNDPIFDGGTEHNQITAAIDAIFTF
jgi:hypothetical protein